MGVMYRLLVVSHEVLLTSELLQFNMWNRGERECCKYGVLGTGKCPHARACQAWSEGSHGIGAIWYSGSLVHVTCMHQ